MMHLLYNTAFTLFLIFSFPYFFLRSLFEKPHRNEFAQRFGCLPSRLPRHPIWVHAASVGEVLCSIPLIKRIREEWSGCKIVVTTMTRTGNVTARKQIPEADEVLFFPWDHPVILKRFFEKMDPALLLIAETELWPNLLRFCEGRRCPSLSSTEGFLISHFPVTGAPLSLRKAPRSHLPLLDADREGSAADRGDRGQAGENKGDRQH